MQPKPPSVRTFLELAPKMRAFARSLTGDIFLADDVAQEALLKAWKSRTSFQTGTNMKAWVFRIVRNQFYTDKRLSRRSTSLDPEVAETHLIANDDPSAQLELHDLRRALSCLPDSQREVVILIGAGGLSYDETAAVCGCPVGTVKSRLSRGRATLAALLATGALPPDTAPSASASAMILAEVDDRCAATRAARIAG